jgi:hypothetical protein
MAGTGGNCPASAHLRLHQACTVRGVLLTENIVLDRVQVCAVQQPAAGAAATSLG